MKILSNLDVMLKSKGITKSTLAKDLGLSVSTVYSWWSNDCNNISIKNIMKISEYFDITIDDFVYKDFSEDEELQTRKTDKDIKLLKELKEIFYKYDMGDIG